MDAEYTELFFKVSKFIISCFLAFLLSCLLINAHAADSYTCKCTGTVTGQSPDGPIIQCNSQVTPPPPATFAGDEMTTQCYNYCVAGTIDCTGSTTMSPSN